jgi:hypothetical protein
MTTQDLRLLPSIMIWWNDGRTVYPGWVTRIYKDGYGDLIITSNAWGDRLEKTEIPYGKDESFHWYFHTVDEVTVLFMKQLGYAMTEKEKLSADCNALDSLKKILHQQAEEAKKNAPPETEADLVNETVEKALQEKKEGTNGFHDNSHPKANANISGKSKATSAA